VIKDCKRHASPQSCDIGGTFFAWIDRAQGDLKTAPGYANRGRGNSFLRPRIYGRPVSYSMIRLAIFKKLFGTLIPSFLAIFMLMMILASTLPTMGILDGGVPLIILSAADAA
jgi:hypothetical protein